jgi:hypothetical protein
MQLIYMTRTLMHLALQLTMDYQLLTIRHFIVCAHRLGDFMYHLKSVLVVICETSHQATQFTLQKIATCASWCG